MTFLFFFLCQKTAYDMCMSDWSSDVCSSDLPALRLLLLHGPDEAGSRALGARYEKALGADHEHVDIPPAELKSDPARLADEAAATSMFGAGSLIRVTNIGDESVDAV